MNWMREAISDGDGLADMAYIAIGGLTMAAIVALAFIFSMSAVDYRNCRPITTVSKGADATTAVIPTNCKFDPLPVGQAAGLIFGAFATLIGALAGYMAATRKQPRPAPAQPPVIVQPGAQAIVPQQFAAPPPAEAATDVAPPAREYGVGMAEMPRARATKTGSKSAKGRR